MSDKRPIDWEYLEEKLGKNIANVIKLSLKDCLENLINQKNAIEESCQKKAWKQMEEAVHKIKGGCVYIGALQAREAAEHLELYLEENNALNEKLYKKFNQELNCLINYINSSALKK